MKPGIEFIVIANRNEDRFRINIDFKCFLPAAVGDMASKAKPILIGVLANQVCLSEAALQHRCQQANASDPRTPKNLQPEAKVLIT